MRTTWIQIIANYDKMLPNYACQTTTCQLNEEGTKTLNYKIELVKYATLTILVTNSIY